MRILVRFKDETGEDQSFEMEGPDRDLEDLNDDILSTLKIMYNMSEIPETWGLRIDEIASGTIH